MSQDPNDDREVLLLDIILSVKIKRDMHRKKVTQLIDRATGDDGGSFVKNMESYVESAISHGICDRRVVKVIDVSRGQD